MNVTPPPLSTFTPPLPETLVANLSLLNIHTVPDLIFIPPSQLLKRLPKGSITFTELTRLIAHVTQAFAGPAITGDKLIEELDALAQFEFVSSGLPALDQLVGGAFGGPSGGRVFEICGPRASGKTVLALHIILHHLESHQADSALWLDTTSDLTSTRIATLASHPRNGPLTRLNIASAFDTPTATRTIEALDTKSDNNKPPQPRSFRIVVVDTVTVLLGPQLSGVSSQGHAEMTMFMRLLREAAQKHGLCILVLNDATAAGRPALGGSFTFMTDATLWLAHVPGPDRELRTVEVLRSRISLTPPRPRDRVARFGYDTEGCWKLSSLTMLLLILQNILGGERSTVRVPRLY